MGPERLEQIERIFHAALEVEDTGRAEFLNEACVSDPDLHADRGQYCCGDSDCGFVRQAADCRELDVDR